MRTPIDREGFKDLIQGALAAAPAPTGGAKANWTFALTGEKTQFIRMSEAKVRQAGMVSDAELKIKLVITGPASGPEHAGKRTAETAFTLQADAQANQQALRQAMARLHAEVPTLPIDPFATESEGSATSESTKRAELLSPEHAARILLEPARADSAPMDLAGIFASGTAIRAVASSTGLFHWFESDSFTLDYSLYTPGQKAVKLLYAGQDWATGPYASQLELARTKQLPAMEREPRLIARGPYRVYLAPAAVAELMGFLAYGGMSEAAMRQKDSPFRLMRPSTPGTDPEKSLSPLFHLSEDFTGGEVPRFNDDGELAPEKLELIRGGKLMNTLVSSRTAAEYKVAANGASEHETLRSPRVEGGKLEQAEILRRLGTGLYLSNLHYLNWSDHFTGRITGMTRYACFWVENGEIVAPIRDLRFDDSVFALLGSELEELTRETSYIAETSSYGFRALGGMRVPGALIRRMEFTL